MLKEVESSVENNNEVKLSDEEINQINIRLHTISTRDKEYRLINTELSILRSELSKYINSVVVLTGQDSDLSWEFDGKKLIKSKDNKNENS